MKKLVVGLFLGLAFIAFGTHSSFADMPGCGDGMRDRGMPMMGGMRHGGDGFMRQGHRMWDRLKDLGLDEKQKEAIKEIKTRAEKDTVRKRADIKVARIELRDILQKDPVDMKAAEAKLKQLESMRTDLRLSHIKTREEIRAQLTPDQKKKLKEDLGKHRRWERGGKGFGRHEEEKG